VAMISGSVKTVFFLLKLLLIYVIYGDIFDIADISDVNASHMQFSVKAKTERNFLLFRGPSLSAL
jgi:hypothetical protein